MNHYVALLRGVNVGGKNRVPMAELKLHLKDYGYQNVATYIASGNVLLDTEDSAATTADTIQKILSQKFKLDSQLVKVLVLTHKQLQTIVDDAPKAFGQHPEAYHSDTVFIIGKTAAELMAQLEPHPEVDTAWEGDGVVYFQRVSAQRTKSRLGRVIAKPIYQDLTIRSWNTTTKLLGLLDARRTV